MLKVELDASAKGHRLVSTEAIGGRELVYKIRGHRFLPKPTYKSVQVDLETHIEENECLGYLNHSCEPNVWINTSTFECIALRRIEPYEELNFFYPSTEWEMESPFICHCGAIRCLRLIAGAKHVPLDTLGRYVINQHIRRAALNCLSGEGPAVEPLTRWIHPGIAAVSGV